jgi:hypothetical protein
MREAVLYGTQPPFHLIIVQTTVWEYSQAPLTTISKTYL